MDTNRRHRAATILLLFVLLLGGLGLLTSDLSAGQPQKVEGVITEAGNPTELLAGVTVTLQDAHGQKAPLIFATGGDGRYTFTPTPGFYRVSVAKAGHYDNETEVFRFDNTVNLIKNLEMEAMPIATLTLTVHVEASAGGALEGADVEVFNATQGQSLGTGITDATGDADFTLWAGTFDVRVDETGFETEVVEDFSLTADDTLPVTLDGGVRLVGLAQEPDLSFIDAGLVAFLYNTDGGTQAAKRLIPANITGSSYTFFAFPGNFILIVDADGKAASISPLTVTVDARIDRILQPSPDERVDTEIRYPNGNWTRLNLWRNLSLNGDSTFPGLPFAQIRNLRLQIDLALGDGNGFLSATERAAFQTYLVEAGPKQVDTEGFFTTNSEPYRSDLNGGVTDYQVSFPSFSLSSGPVQIATLARYTAIDATIPADEAKYFVNVTAPHDTEAEVRVNTTYTVQVVPTYERVAQTITGSVDLQSYVRIVIDPFVAPGNFRVDMEVAKSVAGTARVLVVAPPDRFTETNASVENYTAIVPTDENMTFSAEESTDPNSPDGRINPDSNFTWLFTNVITPKIETAFGIRPNVTFSVMGNYSGNLTIVEVGKNVTFRNFTLAVDGILPIAFLENNVTGFGIDANNTTISVKEGQVVEFFAGNSTDQVHSQLVGVIRAWRWDFDGDGVVDATGRSVDWTFDAPGTFTVNLTAVDQAGHESLNATLTAEVEDTSPPDVAFRILDEDFQEVTSLVEKVTYFFDGSDTTDNLDSVQNMTFSWDFGDGNTTDDQVNATHAYDRFGNYDVTLTVTDRAGNEGNATRSIVVGVETEDRPDLEIEPNVMRIDPVSPEESTLFGSVGLFITFNVTNKPNRARANSVQVTFFAFQFGQSPGDPVPIAPLFRDLNGAATDNTLNAGETKSVEFTWITGPLGNYTLRANVTDPEEPDLFIGPRNSVSRQLDVREAGWKQPLLIGSIIAVIVGIPVALFLRRRLRGRGRGRERITR